MNDQLLANALERLDENLINGDRGKATIKFACKCQACLGRGEPHTCHPAHTGDLHGISFYYPFRVEAIPERDPDTLYRVFMVSIANGQRTAISFPYSIDLADYLSTETSVIIDFLNRLDYEQS